MDVQEFLKQGARYFLPNLSIDQVIIGYEDNTLKCLLLRIGEKWLLPGGYIGRYESVDDAAVRILRERTGLDDPHLKFLSVFGEGNRKFTGEWQEFALELGFEGKENSWFNDRFVSLVYYSLVNMEQTHPVPGKFDQEVAWFPMDSLPGMWMDHKEMVLEARQRLKEDIRHEQFSYKLLPSPFTMPELHQLHQVILGEPIDRSRFQKKMLATGLFRRLPKLKKESPGRIRISIPPSKRFEATPGTP